MPVHEKSQDSRLASCKHPRLHSRKRPFFVFIWFFVAFWILDTVQTHRASLGTTWGLHPYRESAVSGTGMAPGAPKTRFVVVRTSRTACDTTQLGLWQAHPQDPQAPTLRSAAPRTGWSAACRTII